MTAENSQHQGSIRTFIVNAALVVASLLLCLALIEAGYRIFDPFPYISQNEINHTEYGNLTEYDQLLGWRGVPSAQAEFVTLNSRTWLRNNRFGYRDIDHLENQPAKPAIVFLGDSFTWGYEVEFNDMFVNILRKELPDYELYNLSHRGYGTDQELLTFINWQHAGPIRKVILMVSENDVEDNNSDNGSGKPKPFFQVINGKLALMGTPVPRLQDWDLPHQQNKFTETWKTTWAEFFLKSHFIHDMAYRVLLRLQRIDPDPLPPFQPSHGDLAATRHILEELKYEVTSRKAELIVFFIPSKREIELRESSPPYQKPLAELCNSLGIKQFDLAPDFKKSWLRCYYRQGMHLNPHGNRIAAQAIFRCLAPP